MTALSDGFKDVLLAGIGAVATTGEKAREVVDQLIERGELTVDQGKQINTELKHKVEETTANVRYEAIEARMSIMSVEERNEFVEKISAIAEKLNVKAAARAAEEAAAEDAAPEPIDVAALAVEDETPSA